jgi:hypothetical protein
MEISVIEAVTNEVFAFCLPVVGKQYGKVGRASLRPLQGIHGIRAKCGQ